MFRLRHGDKPRPYRRRPSQALRRPPRHRLLASAHQTLPMQVGHVQGGDTILTWPILSFQENSLDISLIPFYDQASSLELPLKGFTVEDNEVFGSLYLIVRR